MQNVSRAIVAAAALTVLSLSSATALADGQNCGCIDVVFAVDTSGSMGGAIDNIKLGLADILDVAKSKAGNDVRVGVVQFSHNAEEINVVLPYSDDNAVITAAVNSLSALGGVGEPESSDDAVWYAINNATFHACTVEEPLGPLGLPRAECRKKIFLITDARPGGCDDTYTVTDDDVSSHNAAVAAAAAGWRINTIHVLDGFEEATSAAILTDMATTSGGIYTEVPFTGEGTADAIIGKFGDCDAIPAMSEWGLAALALVLLIGAKIKFGRREHALA